MNTMYRNNEDGNSGYRQVQNAIALHSDDILASEKIDKKNTSKDELLREIQPEAMEKRAEEKVQDRLYRLAMKVPTMPWAVDAKGDVNEIMECLGRAPKALLHVHSTVGLSVQKLKDMIIEWNQKRLDEAEWDFLIYWLTVTPPGHKVPIESVLMYKKQYDAMSPEEIEKMVTNKGMPLKEWFEQHLSDFYISESRDIETNWKRFGTIFLRTDHLFQNRNFYQEYHKRFFEECLEDNISYVELRTGFAEFTDWSKTEEIRKNILFLRPDFSVKNSIHHAEPLNSPDPVNPNAEFLEAILTAKNAAINNWEKSPVPPGFSKTLEIKVILTANRNKAMHNMEDTCKKVDAAISMKNCIGKVRKDVADMIVGFDFVNREERTWGLTDELHEVVYGKFNGVTHTINAKLMKLKEKRRNELMLFFFHDGESTEIISDRGSNAVTGPICSRHRIGHGFQMGIAENLDPRTDLYGKHIMHYILNGHKNDVGVQKNYPIRKEDGDDKYKRYDKITEPVIELCPISNYMLGYVKDLKAHPAISLMENGILAVICNDDPQLFYSKGLSCDYAMMYIGLKKYFEEKYKDQPKEMENMAKKSAYEYLKLSSLLGYFYKEMSRKYYTDEGNITVVNDDLKPEDENEILKLAAGNFKIAWNEFIKPFA